MGTEDPESDDESIGGHDDGDTDVEKDTVEKQLDCDDVDEEHETTEKQFDDDKTEKEENLTGDAKTNTAEVPIQNNKQKPKELSDCDPNHENMGANISYDDESSNNKDQNQ